MSKIKELIAELKKIGGVSFTAFNYKDKEGEVTKRLINIGVSYKSALEKDLEFLSALRFDKEETLKEQARIELLKSVIMSLQKMEDEEVGEISEERINKIIAENSLVIEAKERSEHKKRSDAQLETYINICTGLKYHAGEQRLYIQGMSVRKTIVEAVEKVDTRRPLTKAKDEIKKEMKSSKYRLFIINSLESGFKINGDTLELN